MCGEAVSLTRNGATSCTNSSPDDDAKPMAAKYLSKWRPGFLEQQKGRELVDGKTEEENKEKVIAAS
jgi:hypothetical protein